MATQIMNQRNGRVVSMKPGVTFEMLAKCILNNDRNTLNSLVNEYENGVLVKRESNGKKH
jgi:hypothetical protein